MSCLSEENLVYPLSVVDGVLPVAVLLDGKQGKAVIGGLAASHLGNDN